MFGFRWRNALWVTLPESEGVSTSDFRSYSREYQTTRTMHWPSRCVCCNEMTDSSEPVEFNPSPLDLLFGVSHSIKTIVPYCPICRRHRHPGSDARLALLLGLGFLCLLGLSGTHVPAYVMLGFVLLSACAFVRVFLWRCVWLLRPACRTHLWPKNTLAIGFAGNGRFAFLNWSYGQLFAVANQAESCVCGKCGADVKSEATCGCGVLKSWQDRLRAGNGRIARTLDSRPFWWLTVAPALGFLFIRLADAPVAPIDKTPPVLTCSATPSSLWPPNKEMVPVSVSVVVTDDLSGPDGFTLINVKSNEPLARIDWSEPTTGRLEADQLKGGNGRFYTLAYLGRDKAGNTATCTVTVPVAPPN